MKHEPENMYYEGDFQVAEDEDEEEKELDESATAEDFSVVQYSVCANYAHTANDSRE